MSGLKITIKAMIGAGFMALLCTGNAQAAGGAGTAKTSILGALSISNSAPLDFGTMLQGPSAGTVTINAQTSARTAGGGAILTGGPFGRAVFNANGAPGAVVTFAVSPGTITLTRAGGTETMTVNTLRLSVNGGNPTGTNGNRIIPSNGILTLGLGGRLAIGVNQAAGTYNGTFNLSVNYQ